MPYFNSFRRVSRANDSLRAVLYIDGCKGTPDEVNYIEQVEILVTIDAQVRGSLELTLISPMGTPTLLLPVIFLLPFPNLFINRLILRIYFIIKKRPLDKSKAGFDKWIFLTVQLWGELSRGDWTLLVSNYDGRKS